MTPNTSDASTRTTTPSSEEGPAVHFYRNHPASLEAPEARTLPFLGRARATGAGSWQEPRRQGRDGRPVDGS